MDIVSFVGSLNLVDVLIVVYLVGCFILGWAQGAIRRLVGILTVTFSFFLAAQLQVPLGSFLAAHWTQFPADYPEMIGFGALFIAGVVAFALIVQGTYSRVEVFAAHPIVDEVLGGILGLVEGGLLLMFVMIILDQFFLLHGAATDSSELPFLGGFWTAVTTSAIGGTLHDTVIPAFISAVGFLLPEGIRSVYGK